MSIRYTITFKNMINVYKMVRYCQLRNVCLISIVLAKSFNSIPCRKKYGIFSVCTDFSYSVCTDFWESYLGTLPGTGVIAGRVINICKYCRTASKMWENHTCLPEWRVITQIPPLSGSRLFCKLQTLHITRCK